MTTTHPHVFPAAGEQHRALILDRDPAGHPRIATRYHRPGHEPILWPVTINAPGLEQLIRLAEAAQLAVDAGNAGPHTRPTTEQYDAACGTVHMADVNGVVEFVSLHARTLRIMGVGTPWVVDVFTNYHRGNYHVCIRAELWPDVIEALKEYRGA